MPLGLAFPNHEHSPALAFELAFLTSVAPRIALELRAPVSHACFGNPIAGRASMLMPEATVDEDHRAKSGKHQIGPSRQIAYMQAIAVSEPMDKGPHE
jgi:hypothetical protein